MLEPESKKKVDLVQMGEAKNGRNRAGCSIMPHDSPVRLRKQHGDMFIS